MVSTNLVEKIQQLKMKRKAVILAHNYQLGEVQDIADITGDSLALSEAAVKTKANRHKTAHLLNHAYELIWFTSIISIWILSFPNCPSLSLPAGQVV